MDPQNQRESFGSRLGFILVSAGCAIGIGNVWRFPTVTGQYGGGIFVLFYLLFLVLMGLPVLTMELAVGRAGRGAARSAYKALERDAAAQLATLAPHPARRALAGYLTGDVLTEKERQLLKAADRLSALIKCIEEENTGNHEFTGAKAQQTAALHAMQCPEAEYFLEHMLPCYAWTLDELSRE